jgi:hypothetical protein
MKRLMYWFLHLRYIHYPTDLGSVLKIETLPYAGHAALRACKLCGRVFVDVS